MSRFPSLPSILRFHARRGGLFLFCLSAALLTLLASASAQDFTLTMADFSPFAVEPGGTSSSNITLVAGPGFTGTVSLSCQVTSSISGATPPQCTMSPQAVQPSGNATANIVTSYVLNGQPVTATAGAYTVVVTGTGPSTTHQGSRTVTVLALNPEFTITIQNPVLPSSVHAGSGGIGTVSVNPIFGYQGTVTLSCASITPLVTVPPACQFTYPSGSPGVPVNGAPATAQISVITYGPIPITAVAHPRGFYALWLPLPLLLFTGFGAAIGGKRSRKAWGMLSLFILGGSLLLVPACSSSNNTNNPNNTGNTPNNAYTFTLMGVDQNGNTSTNTGTANQAPTVTLTVD
jgi:hypothetical protein